MLFRKRLKRVTPEQEQAFSQRMQEVPFVDKLIMIGTALVVIVIPCLLVLLAMSLLTGWILGLI